MSRNKLFYNAEGVHFMNAMGAEIIPQKQGDAFSLNLRGSFHEDVQQITAYYNVKDDSTKNTKKVLLGALNVISYDQIEKNLVLVPVNGNSTSIPRAQLETYLNDTYSPANVRWTVSRHAGVQVEYSDDMSQGLDDGESKMLSNYTKEMNKVIKALKRSGDYDKHKTYVFLVDKAQTANKAGFMPKKRPWGFVFTNIHYNNSKALCRTISHEVAHGEFRLSHPFQDFPSIPENSTQNLMDYADGQQLRKYQWDDIHNLRDVELWGQDEEGNAATINPINSQYTLLFDLVNKYAESAPPPLDSYFGLIDRAITNSIASVPLTYTDDYADTWTDVDKKWIDEWSLRAKSSADVLKETCAISAIKKTGAGKKIDKIILKEKHIYLAKYTIKDDIYPIAIYGDGTNHKLENIITKRQVNNLDSLISKTNIKHIYCDDALFSKYLVIAFYEKDKNKPSMMIQVMPPDNFTINDIKERWLKYLGIYMESLDGKTIDEIFLEYDVLTASQIAYVRNLIEKEKDETKRGDYYQELQTKVAYHNQVDNVNSPYRTCNVTSLAMGFEMLGVSKEDYIAKAEKDGLTISDDVKNGDFEDLLEHIRKEKKFGDRTSASTWTKLAKYNGLKVVEKAAGSSKNKPELTKYLNERLRAGDGILMSIAYEKGHIVRLQSINDTKVVIDDPYGTVSSLAKREFKGLNSSSTYDRNTADMSDSGQKGEDCPVAWNEFDVSVEQGNGGNEEIKADKIFKYEVDGIVSKESFEDWLKGKAIKNIGEYDTREETKTETVKGKTITTTTKYYITKGATVKYYRIFSKP
ncbi:C39 family peptidase [Labilibaculum sp.]|uniref:C39 family peptidase n=1 Tax=Labilibaculum sp. TaxID=2060723 RepID=UPI002AA91A23|nr:C39 family peptidase [Labilibaculum sp.]